MRRIVTVAIAWAMTSGVATAMPQGGGNATPPALMVNQVKPDVYVVTGAGGNSTVVVAKNLVIVVDAKVSAAGGAALVAEIGKITPKPISFVFLTHSDADHITGLASFPPGVKVVANEGNKREQQEATAAGGRGVPPPQSMPNITTTKAKQTMTIDGLKVELYHWGPAHTQGDLVVYFPEQKVVATGDIIQANRADNSPLMHYPEKRGSSQGWFTSMKNMIALNADVYVPGHGDNQTKADLQRRVMATQQRYDLVASLVKQGKTLDEIKAASPEARPAKAPPPPPAGQAQAGGPPAGTFVDLVYAELTAKK
jgi:glyoxylase-like metal-dependent hydrolase (beta-lactamase superfamily II)